MKKFDIVSIDKAKENEKMKIFKKIADEQDEKKSQETLSAEKIAQSIIFSVILITGTALFAFITYTGIDWFYVTLFFFTCVIIGIQKFFR